jgi:hypothetical protein
MSSSPQLHNLPKALSSVSHIHPLVTRIHNDPDFFLMPQPDLHCMNCGCACDSSPPISMPIQREKLFGTRVNIAFPSYDFRHTVTRTRKIYCNLHCLKRVCFQTNQHSLFNDYAEVIYESKLNPVTELRAALPFWTLIEFGGVLDHTNYQLWNTSGKLIISLMDHLSKLKNKISIKKYIAPSLRTSASQPPLPPSRLIKDNIIPYEWLMLDEPMYIIGSVNLASLFVSYDFSQEKNIYSAENHVLDFLMQLCPLYRYSLDYNHASPLLWYEDIIDDAEKEKNICCWNDYHPIGKGGGQARYPGVLEYDETTRQVTEGTGIFCSPSCNESYCMKLRGNYQQTREVWNHEIISHFFVHDRQIQITPAPPRRILKMFGGIWTIDEYRDAFYKYTVTLNEHPLIKYPVQVEREDKEDEEEEKTDDLLLVPLKSLYKIDYNNYQFEGVSGKKSELQKTTEEKSSLEHGIEFNYVLHIAKEKETEEEYEGKKLMFDLMTISIQKK